MKMQTEEDRGMKTDRTTTSLQNILELRHQEEPTSYLTNFRICFECPLWEVSCISPSLLSSSLADSVNVTENMGLILITFLHKIIKFSFS